MARRNDHRAWTRAEDDEIRARCARGEFHPQIAEAVNRSFCSVRGRMKQLGIQIDLEARKALMVRPVAEYTAPDGPTLVQAFAPEHSDDEPEDMFWDRMLTSADRSIAKAEGQRHARLRIASDRPVAISLSSDWHVAPKGTDLRALRDYAQFVAQTPDMYALGVGDLTDNPIKHRGGSVREVTDELRLLDLLVGEFRGKLLGFTSGNHDDWTKALAGVDNLKALAHRHKIHYAPDELLWVVEIVDPKDAEHVTATYRIHTRHKWRRNSNLNPLHACWTWLQEEGVNWSEVPDVLAIGDNHLAAIGSHQYARRDVWGLRMGAWQKDSSYARAIGFARYRATAPTVVLQPTQGRVVCFADPEDAVTFMHGSPYKAA